MSTRKELQVIITERDRITDAIQALEEKYKSSEVSKADYQFLRERYANRLREINQKLGVKKKEKKPSKFTGLRFWRKKSS